MPDHSPARLKVQALELYRTIGKYYPYALTAEGDASRAKSGNTREYSSNVWGSLDDGTLAFRDLEGWRGGLSGA